MVQGIEVEVKGDAGEEAEVAADEEKDEELEAE